VVVVSPSDGDGPSDFDPAVAVEFLQLPSSRYAAFDYGTQYWLLAPAIEIAEDVAHVFSSGTHATDGMRQLLERGVSRFGR
jgi:hypothetical protein